MNEMSDLSETLKTLRKENGLLQGHIADEIGISKAAYSTYEIGTREPNIKTLIRLANYYNVTVDYLIGKEEKATSLTTLTTQFSSDEYTKEELKEISNFAEFLKTKRIDKKNL